MNDKSLIVIVTYNSGDFIEDCLASIAEQDYKKWQLVVLDNDSNDNTVQKIRSLRNQSPAFDTENFKLIPLKKNIGFAGAVNYVVFNSIKITSKNVKENNSSDFEYLVLLNPDMYLLPGALKSLTDTFKSENGNSIGACGGLILDYEKNIIQHLSGKKTLNFITYHDGAGINLSDIKTREAINEVDYITGAFFATRFSLFTGAGGFDRGYRPVYFEELDYCLKLKEAGWQIASNMFARCRHFEGASIKKFSNRFYRYYHKNRIRCAIINLDIPEFIRFFIPAEIKWLIRKATKDQTLPILYAYSMNKLMLLYNLGVKIKNYFILNRIELK